MPIAVICALLATVSSAFAQPVVLDCGNARVVATENPEVPYMSGGLSGGLDADYPGDDAGMTVCRGEVGKQYYGSPDSLVITVEASAQAKALVVKIGYLAYKYGTPVFEVRWDDELVGAFDARDPSTSGVSKIATIELSQEQSRPGRHVVKITENSGSRGQYAKIDAVAFEGDPKLVIITPKGKRFVPRPPRVRKARAVDTNLRFFRERDGAPVREVFGPGCLERLLERWILSGAAGGTVSFTGGAVHVPTPPDEVHGLASPARGDAGSFCLLRKAEFPPAGIIRIRLKSVYTGDEAVMLASFSQPDGKDRRYFARFRGHIALSDGKFVHNIIPVDDEFHDLKVVYGGGKADVFCDGERRLSDQTWPELGRVTIGHAFTAKGYGIGVAVEEFFVYPLPGDHPVEVKLMRDGKPVAGSKLHIKIGDRELDAVTDADGLVSVELEGEADYPQALSVRAEASSVRGLTLPRGEVFPGDRWVLNLSGKPPAARPAASRTQVDVALGRTEWRLDFGEAGTPVARGFEGVSADTDASGRAYGWVGKGPLVAGEFPEAQHPVATDFLDAPQSGDSITFEVATWPGSYVVSLVCGAEDVGQEFEVWCENEGVAAVRQARAGTCGIYSFPASTQDGAMTLRFSVGASLCLAGMLITPADPADPAARRAVRFAKELQHALTIVRAMAQGIMPNPPDPEPEPELSAQDQARGFASFPHSYMRTVYASSRPRPGEVGAVATGFACPAEYEPITFSIWPLKPLQDCRLVVSALKSEGGAVIPASQIDVKAVRIWPQRFGKNTFRRIPELIEEIPEEGLALPVGEVKTFWLTVKTPEGQAPGDYRGEATFTCDAGELRTPIWLKVLPIDRASLDDLVMGMYWSFSKSAKRDLETARKQLADMREHGCNGVTMSESIRVVETEEGKSFDFADLDRLMSLCKEMGFTAPMPFHGLSAYTERGLYKRLVQEVVERGKERDWPELLFYPVDEPGRNKEKIELCRELCELIKTVPGARTYVTTNGRGVDAEALAPWLDVRCYQHLSYNPEEARKTKEDGDELWFYTGPPSSILITRMNEGIWWYRSEMTAHFYWHYCYPIGDPWYDFDGKGDYCAAYPGEDGPIATIGWEGVREGLDDLRYFRTLEARVKTALDKGIAKDLAAEASKYLRELCERIPADGAEIKEARAAIALEEYVAIRWQVAKYILALDKALWRRRRSNAGGGRGVREAGDPE